jgi:iron(III) transport system permease protein
VRATPARRLYALPALRMPDASVLVPGALVVVLLYLTVVPLWSLFWGSLHVEGQPGFTLENFVTAYTSPTTRSMLINSLVYASGAAGLALVLGVALAWVVDRTNTPGREWFFALALMPIVIPGIVNALAWVYLLGPRIGWINSTIDAIFGTGFSPFTVYGMAGMIWVEGLHLSPLAFLLVSAAFKSMDPTLEEAAATAGVGPLTVLLRVTLRLVAPAIVSAGLLMFVQSLQSFEVPGLLGTPARVLVFTNQIYVAFHRTVPDFGLGSALAAGLMVFSFVGVGLFYRIGGSRNRHATITGKAFRPRLLDLGRWRWATCGGLALYILLITGLPLLILFWTSFLPYYQAPNLAAFKQFTLENYQFILTYPAVGIALRNSLILGVAAAMGTMLLTTVIAWITVKTRLPGRQALDLLAFLPIGIPGLVLGVSLIFQYLNNPLPIYGTLWILLIAYVIGALPYGMRISAASMVQIHRELEEAAAASGGGWWAAFRWVTIPLLTPSLIAGGTYIFITSIRDLGTVAMLTTSQTNVLSLLIFDAFQSSIQTKVSALSVVLVIALIAIASVARRFGAQFGVRA